MSQDLKAAATSALTIKTPAAAPQKINPPAPAKELIEKIDEHVTETTAFEKMAAAARGIADRAAKAAKEREEGEARRREREQQRKKSQGGCGCGW